MSPLPRLRPAPLLVLPLLLLAGCATIVGGGSTQPVSIKSTPASASFTIQASSGIEIASGVTPETVRLPRKNEYQMEFTAPGFQPRKIALTKGTNGWIWGNLLVGWIVGFAVDFATGSAYKLEPAFIDIALVKVAGASGAMETAASVKMHNKDGKLIRELTVPLVPIGVTTEP